MTRACGSERRRVRIAAPASSLASPASTKMTSGLARDAYAMMLFTCAVS